MAKARSAAMRRARERLQSAEAQTARALIAALDLRERETAGHSHRVALWTLLLADWCGVAERELEAIHTGALLHDVGKIAVPDPILLKRGRLTPREWRVMRLHPEHGRRLLEGTGALRRAAAIPWCHHERFDGRGYPRGIAGRRIPLGARLFAIVDVYDALRSARPYKRAWPHARAIAEIESAAGAHFDPRLVARFVELPEALLRRLARDAGGVRRFASLRARVAAAIAKLRRGQGGGAKGPEASSSPARRVRSTPRTRSRRPRAGS